MSNLNLDSILEELSNMKFDDNASNKSDCPRPPRKSSTDYHRKPSRIATNFNSLLDELDETQEILEKDNSLNREPPLSPRSDKTEKRKYSAASNYSRSRSRSRDEADRWRENSLAPGSPTENSKIPSRKSSINNQSNKTKLYISQYSRSRENSKSSSRAPSLKVPEISSPVKPNYEFDDDNLGSLPSSYRDDYEYMMSNYNNNITSPRLRSSRNDESLSPPLRTQKIPSKSASKYNSPITSPDAYSRSYSSNEVSPYLEKKSLSNKKKSSKNRYSDDDDSEDEILGYRNSRKYSKSKYINNSRDDDDDDDDIFLYENDADDHYNRKTSPVHSHGNRAYKEEDFDEDESDITLSESSDSFMSSSSDESDFDGHSSDSDDNTPLQSVKAKPTGIRGRNRHYKKFNTIEPSSYLEEKSPVRASRSVKKTSSVKKEKKKRALSNPTKYAPVAPLSSNSIRSPKESNYYEETARENFLARSKKDFTTDYAEASIKKMTTRIYIGDAITFETVMLTSVMTAREVINDLIRVRKIPDTQDWTLFELCNDFGVERPLKEWEIVTDVISSWEIQTTKNALIMKKYNYYESLKASSAVGRFPSIRGKLYMETKPGKYNKKQFELRPNGLYYYKKKASQETLLVNLKSYDVYTLLVQMPNAPTEFAFAIKSTDPIHIFEDKKKYIYYLYAEDINSLFDWVMSIRQGKTEKYVLEQHEKENNQNMISRSPTGLVQKQPTYRAQPTLLEEKQRIKGIEAQKSRKYQKEGSGPLVQIDQKKTKPASRSKSISSRKTSGASGLLPSASRSRKEKNGPLINLDGIPSSRKGSQSGLQSPLSSNSRRGPKPLVDISDAKNCHYCGCSEYKYDPWKINICANCHHDHKAF